MGKLKEQQNKGKQRHHPKGDKKGL